MGRRAARAWDKVILVAASGALAAKANVVPSKELWTETALGGPLVPVALLAVVAIFGALTPFEWWYTRTLSDRKTVMRRQILTSFGRMIEFGRHVEPALRAGDLALHFWKVQRTFKHPISGVLRRLSTYRMSSTPQTRTFAPTKAMGAVGLCWLRNHEVKFNAAELDGIRTEEEFDSYRDVHGGESVMNLNWSIFQSVRHRRALFVVPIRNAQNRFIGCISVDAERGFEFLDQTNLVEEMNTLSVLMSRDEFELV